MTLLQAYSIVHARWRIIVLVGLLAAATAGLTSLLLPHNYNASSALILNYKGADPLTGTSAPGQSASGYLPTYLATQIEIIKSAGVARLVAQRLREQQPRRYQALLPEGAAGMELDLRDKAVGERLLRRLQVKPARESSVINITVSDPDAGAAAWLANTFADQYRRFSADLEAAPARAAATYFAAQVRDAGAALQDALGTMARFQESHGIVSSVAGNDAETLRLNELGNALVGAQAQAMEASSRRVPPGSGVPGESPDISNNPLIQALKIDLSKANVKYQALSRRFTAEHPTALAVAAEIASIQKEIARQSAVAAQALQRSSAIFEQRERALHDAYDAQKNRLLGLHKDRAELVLLNQRVQAAQRSYDAMTQRLAQTRLQAQSTQSDIGVLGLAPLPQQPAGPGLPLSLAAGLLAGLVLGTALAFVQEAGDRRIRSASDLQRLFGLPPLATLPPLPLRSLAAAQGRFLALKGAL